jgi:hypothetical protein
MHQRNETVFAAMFAANLYPRTLNLPVESTSMKIEPSNRVESEYRVSPLTFVPNLFQIYCLAVAKWLALMELIPEARREVLKRVSMRCSGERVFSFWRKIL